MKSIFFAVVLLSPLVLLTACGMEPSGGDNAATEKPNSETHADEKDSSETGNTTKSRSADAKRSGVAQLPESYGEINTADVTACHGSGKVFNRRTLKCSKTIFLATSFECTKSGISDGFIYSGYQIDLVLAAAETDGFIFDQCGETEDGRRLVFFVRADDDGTYSVREIETSIN
jgi:hypothetical protein